MNDQQQPHPERLVAGAFAVSLAGSVAFVVAFWLDAGNGWYGVTLAAAFGGLAAGFVAWAYRLTGQGTSVEEHEQFASTPGARHAFADEYRRDTGTLARRGFIGRVLAGALGALGLAALVPVRSLGPRPGDALRVTPWRDGLRLTTDNGRPIRPQDLPLGGILTVYPEGHLEAGDVPAVLIHVGERELRLAPEGMAGTVSGLVAYSKLCTHAGCPVGLFDTETRELFCPCHQSVFDVLSGATPVAGPATRPLPQLPLTVGPDGELRAGGDFSGPVGPGFWSREA